jgi:hypothetical protein
MSQGAEGAGEAYTGERAAADGMDGGSGDEREQFGQEVVGLEPDAAPSELAHVSLKVDSVRHLFGMLSAIYNGRKDTYAVVAANAKGGCWRVAPWSSQPHSDS